MVALFGDAHDTSTFSFASVPTLGPTPTVTPKAAPTAGDPLANSPAGLVRLGDILPQVLARYGLGDAQQTNRPDIARGRRRVG